VRAETVKRIARECGFELAGVAPAEPPEDFARYQEWVANGFAGEMRYLTDRRAQIRSDVHNLLPAARSVICVGKLYNQSAPPTPPAHGIVARYAWGQDYHDVVRAGLEELARRLREIEPFDSKICVDTAPLLERSFARRAGLGWIGKNTCLIHEPMGSWFFLGEMITSLELEPDVPPADRCGTCTRCIDACPTEALLPAGDCFMLDSRRCISYFTIELRGSIPEQYRSDIGTYLLGCDICQDVCPWNARAPESVAFTSVYAAPDLAECSCLSEEEFALRFEASALNRPRYSGFLRNVAIAIGNSRLPSLREPLEALTRHSDPVVAEHGRWAMKRLDEARDETIK
jgi:epoxyqueuosine reductase